MDFMTMCSDGSSPPPPDKSKKKYTIALIVFDLRIVGGVETISYDLAIGLQERGYKVIIFHIQDLTQPPFVYRHISHRDLSPLHIVQIHTNVSSITSSVQKTPPTHKLKNLFFKLFQSCFIKVYNVHQKASWIDKVVVQCFNTIGKWVFTEKFTNLYELLAMHKVDIVIDNYFKFRTLFPRGIPSHIRHAIKVVHADFPMAILINAMRDIPQLIRKNYHHLLLLTNEERSIWEKWHPSVHKIPNFIIPQQKCSTLDCPIIVAVARLEEQKALHRLIIIFWALTKTEGVSFEDFVAHFKKYPHSSQYMSFTSGALRRKGRVRNFIKEALDYRPKQSFPHWTLRIVGDGTERKALEDLVVLLGMGDRVIFEGTKTRAELYPILQEASIFAVSSFNEGLPLNILEAISVGLPIIGFNIAGCRDLVRDNGFLIENHQLIPYVDKLQLLMTDYSLRKRFGIASLDLSRHFYKDTVLQQWEDLFHS